MTNVLLGCCDQLSVVTDTDWSSNKIGGKPDWIKDDLFSQVTCETCKGQVIFIGQLCCPVEEITRVLYLFLCTNMNCITSCKSWTIIRCQENIQRSDAPVFKPEVKSVFEFDTESQDWSDDDDTTQALIYPKNNLSSKSVTIQERSNLSSCYKKNIPLENVMESLTIKSQETFKPFFIDVFDEDLTPNDSLKHEQELLQKYLRQENVSLDDIMIEWTPENAKKSQNESYQKFNISHINQKKFVKKTKKFPNQILRYSYKGEPLIYGTQNLKVPCCPCGSQRIFEAQVMPAITSYMVANANMPELSLGGLDIGTVYIFTCSSHCWKEGMDEMKYECAVVEMEI